ncbi:MAG: gamma-glutamyltransferase family protein [Rhodospirillales bacterium]
MFSPYRARMMGTKHMVAAGHYLAAQAGFQILEAGGNAIDAGVASGIALEVLLGEFVNFGGVAPIIIYSAKDDKVVTISGLGWWPKATKLDVFHKEYGGRIPPGLLRTVVPAAPDAWLTALEHYGTMRFADVVAPSLRMAREGFPMAHLSHEVIASRTASYRRWPSGESIFLPNGEAPKVGDVFVQSDLADTFQYLCDEEAAAKGSREKGLQAARDAFYKGDIAQKIVAFHRDNGGWLTAADLAEFRVEIEDAPSVEFQGFRVFGCGPWCQGPVLLETLGILDGVDLGALGHNSADYAHVLIEALKVAFADRHAYVGDPRFVDVPMQGLLSKAYTAARRAGIDMKKAAPGMPAPGTPAQLGMSGGGRASKVPPAAEIDSEMKLDTAFACVVDRHGNAFAATPSDGTHSSPIIPGTGITPSPRGVQSWTDPDHPACLAPGKRPRLTPNPAIAIKKGDWLMPFGSPGNDVQCQAMIQMLLNIHVFGMPLQDAAEQPRFATVSYPRSSEPHEYTADLLNVESRFDKGVAAELADRGHRIKWWPDWDWRAGTPCAVLADKKTGVLEGGADPRRPSAVAGW